MGTFFKKTTILAQLNFQKKKVFSVALFAYFVIMRNAGPATQYKIFLLMLVVNYGVTWTVGISLFSANAFGFSGAVFGDVSPWCWIIPDNVFRMVFFYGPSVFVLFANIFLYVPILKTVQGGLSLIKRKVQRRFFLYIVVYSFCMLPGLCNRLQEVFYPQPVFSLVVLEAISFPLEGFLNALVYSQRKALKMELCSFWKGEPFEDSEDSNDIQSIY